MERIDIGIVGLNFGKAIIKELEDNNYFRVAAVCDLDKEKADQVACETGVKAYYNLDNLLKNTEIPTVALFAGPSGRAELISKII